MQFLEEQLLQMQKQYTLISPGSTVLDLGCAPGAWLQVSISIAFYSFMWMKGGKRSVFWLICCEIATQVACQSLGPKNNGGAVVGIDIKVTLWNSMLMCFLGFCFWQWWIWCRAEGEGSLNALWCKGPDCLCWCHEHTQGSSPGSLP